MVTIIIFSRRCKFFDLVITCHALNTWRISDVFSLRFRFKTTDTKCYDDDDDGSEMQSNDVSLFARRKKIGNDDLKKVFDPR